MGLDAVVFLDIDNLSDSLPKEKLQIDEDTGELYFVHLRPPDISRDFAVAKEIRIGNISAIGTLRREVAQLLGEESFIVQKLLYSGSHSGDFIGLSSLSELELELSELEALGGQLQNEVSSMVSKLRALASEAKKQGNPIVFL